MPTNILADVFASGKDLIPHIELAAYEYVKRGLAMRSRVKVLTDMTGFNTRKVSEYLQPPLATELAENTDIPTSLIRRTRTSSIEIKEYGSRYELTDRLIFTDLEDIVAQVAMALARGLADREEIQLIKTAYEGFNHNYTIGDSSTALDYKYAVRAMTEFRKRRGTTSAGDGVMYVGVHPYQQQDVWESLATINGAGFNMQFREDAVRNRAIPLFGNMEYVMQDYLPRNVLSRVKIDGTGGTFRLSVAGLTTGSIAVSATPATTATNIKTALDALSLGTWTVVANGANNLDIDVTPPTSLFVHADEELKVAVDYANDPTIDGFQKSAYDLVTTPSGVLGQDQFGENYGVVVEERSGWTKSPVWFRDAILFDLRQPPTAYMDVTKQGRVAEWSLYEKFGTAVWRPQLGMFIVSKATSPTAVP